ncbi:uncharacterized protein LOC129886525 [Solanum dulcamara]|uniref:uncharacterized protein LOC129886525 n=1 Tax=Solanum dulcamara TaxID=45834 RepID=UPI002485A973|nr:uncharacterized protein LOC129886525 [Solanum dulcamara]XP_055817211.1 uncharacterized protein LOC129886525 [Solanum dulcamara]
MSLENEDRSVTNHVSEIGDEVRKHPKVSYTREFLLSLSQLEICQKLPTGFDQLILSELEDTSRGIQDRQKLSGNLPSQGFRRNDYSSSPPTRGDSDGNSRGIYGRWDSRSSGRSDRDSDSQSDKDSDPGRRYGNQARRTWQSSEHDGLLGSGSFPRPSAYASGTAATKVRASDNYQLNRSNEPYHPPRPYKAVPHSRRNTDAFNDETFGSVECASEDRVEEERKRRASFELMRKEQQKALQEKQKPNAEKHTAEYDSEISVLLDDKKDRGVLDKNTKVDIMASQPIANNDSGKSSSSSQNLPSRPLVPPGFKTTVTDKTSGSTTLNHSCLTEIGKQETEEILLEAKDDAQNGIHQSLERHSSRKISSSDQLEHRSLHTSTLKKNDQIVNLSVSSDDSDRKHSMGDHSLRTSSLEGHEALNEPSILELSAQNSGGKFVEESNINNSTSILDKIFGSAIANLSDSVAPVMNESSKPNETLDSKAVQSSKFAHWFFEEERKQEDDPSSSRPSDLLALIVGGDKNRTQPFEANASDQFPSEFSYHSPDPTSKFVSDLPSSPLGGPEPVYKPSKRDAAPIILTCEDLEHIMLSEFSEKKSNSQPKGWNTNHTKPKEPVIVDSQASQHLLSLLQKRPDHGNVTEKSNAGIESLQAPVDITLQDRSKKEDNKDTLTLESLFGTAFMTELQSAQAPVSVQRISVGSGLNISMEAQKSSLPGSDDTVSSSIIDDIGFRRATKENIVLPSDCSDHTKMDKAENWLGCNDSLYEVNSRRQTGVASRNGDYRAGGFHLPEGESLFSVGDPLVPQASTFMPAGNMSKGDLATVNSVGSDQMSLMGPGAPPFPRVSHDQIESEMLFHHLHAQPSSSQFHPLQMNQGKPPLLHPLDSRPAHLNTQILSGPEGMTRHEALPGHQFAGNMMRPPFHHPNSRVTGFDLPAHHPMLQQMQMSGPHPPHLLHERLGVGPVPSHSSNPAAGFVHEANPMQGFPFKPHQVNVNGLGMQMPGPDINSRNNHPDALQRLIEMELRASKQIHPFPSGRGQGMYGHELDMGLRHR